MFKFIHAADIHLDSPLHRLDAYEGAPVDQIRQATRFAFENVVNLAIGHKVSFVLLSGDLYDGDWKDYNTGLYFISQMRKLQDADIAVFIIAGNHDAANKITKYLKLPDGVRIFPSNKPETYKLTNLDVAIHGQSFASPAIKKDLASEYPAAYAGYFNIGMLHTSITGKKGHAPYAPCTIDALTSKGYDYWALGHVHKFEMIKDDPVIVFPGNIQGRHIRETGAKGCLLVRVFDNGKPEAEFLTTDVIRWFTLTVDAADTDSCYEIIDRFKTKLEELLTENQGIPLVVRVIISGSTTAHTDLLAGMDRWKNEIRATAADVSHENVWIEKIKFNTDFLHSGLLFDHADGPLKELSTTFEGLRDNPEDIISLITEELTALELKLPIEIKTGDDPLSLSDPKWLSGLMEQIQPILIQRLMKKGDAK